MAERDWMQLIDKTAALKEQFPSIAKVRRERPGTPRDRELRELYYEDNRRSWGREPRLFEQPHDAALADADRFIDHQRERELADYRAKWHEKHGRTA
jgi:hypothetical protein